MAPTLPEEIVDRLIREKGNVFRPGGQLDFFRLAAPDEVALVSLTVRFDGTHLEALDPYLDLGGYYEVEAFDLIVESEPYRPEALLVWLPKLGRLGTADPSHEALYVFERTSIDELLNDPRPYLDSQWNADRGKGVLPPLWITHPCFLEDLDLVVEPYPPTCPVHERRVATSVRFPLNARRREVREAVLRRSPVEYFEARGRDFPCPALPISRLRQWGCTACSRGEHAWFREMEEAAPVLEGAVDAEGWMTCPGCGVRFKVSFERSFRNGRHTSCGTKIRPVPAEGSSPE